MPVKREDEVKVHIRGTLKNGKVFADTKGKEPVKFKVGAGEILPGIDEGVIGMEKNEEKEITVPPEKGFGVRRDELVINTPKDTLKGKKVEVGQRIPVRTRQGRTVSAQVMNIRENKVTLDLNHPFAGKETTFRIKVVNISKERNE